MARSIHATEFSFVLCDCCQEMLAGAVAWATGAAEAELTANMSKVTPQAGVMPPEN